MPQNTRTHFESPMRQAIFERIANAVGPVTRTDLLLLFPATTDALAKAHADLVDEHLRELTSAKQIVNVSPGGRYAYWVKAAAKAEAVPIVAAADVEASVAADDNQPEQESPYPPPPRWIGTPALPPQYDVMRAPVYVPPPMTSVRPGADAHLKFKSAGHLC